MRYYFAPMEGLTDNAYRILHHKYFPGIDRYYMPFLSPTVHRTLTYKETRELPPADSVNFLAIPQILTKSSDDFLWAAEQCLERGYPEVNLNLGCPSGTVFAKGKGSGMLGNPDALNAFLEAIFASSPLPISVKTRLGTLDAAEFPQLLEIFNQYPICELTIHPRVRKQFYNGNVDLEMFTYAAVNSKNPLCYNGDVLSRTDAQSIQKQFPNVGAVMIGRGLIADPGMLTPGGTDAAVLRAFHDALLETYLDLFGGSRNAMFRLKEHWGFLLTRFENSEKLGKKLRKTTDLSEYRSIVAEIFETLHWK